MQGKVGSIDIRDVIGPRRIVTGDDLSGRSYVARIDQVMPIDYAYTLPGRTPPPPGEAGVRQAGAFFRVWASDRLPVPLPTDGKTAPLDFRPGAEETEQALRRASILPPPLGMRVGWANARNPSPPGAFHWTDSTDFLFIMAGKHGQILEEGEVMMYPGDVLVQNGTIHSHQTVEPSVIGYVTVSALRVGPHPPTEILHPVSGQVGGWRPPETREKNPMPAWHVPGPEPRDYPASSGPASIEEMKVPRRVVTGTNEKGRSYFARVETGDPVVMPVARAAFSGAIWRIWGSDHLPDLLPVDGRTLPVSAYPVGRELPPEAIRPAPLGVTISIARIDPMDEEGPMHRRDGVDTVFVMGGELTQRLDQGEVTLQAGDVMVINGTNHAWQNRGRAPAVIGIASFGGARYPMPR
jgi:uncharacterized cupin superfamily protein